MKFLIVLLVSLVLSTVGFSEDEKAPASRDISVSEAAELLTKNKDVIVLDIRTPEEFKSGHIEGARLINFLGDDFDSKIAVLDKDVTYIMHCASGGRSGSALPKFKSAGFKSVLHLNSGFKGWEASGKPVAR